MAANKPSQILQLTPATEIIFEGPFDDVVTSYLELRNPSTEKVCFKVKTTAPRRYCVRPNSGIVEPSSKVKIAIMLQPIEQDNQAERNKHKFMVQSTIIRNEGYNLETVWANAAQEDIMDSKLRCVFQTQTSTNANKATSATNITSATIATDAITATNATIAKAAEEPTTTTTNTLANPAPTAAPVTTTPAKSKPTSTTTTSTNQQHAKLLTYANISEKQQSAAGDRMSIPKGRDTSQPSPAKPTSSLLDTSRISSQNFTTSDVIVSLIMLFIGVILGKYII